MRKTERKKSAPPCGSGRPGAALSLAGAWRDALESYGAAAAMAEGGDSAAALDIIGDFHAEHRKIVVFAEDGVLPEALITYSLGLAERLGFDIVLLDVFAKPRAERKIREAAQPMLTEAARRGIACAQIVRRGNAEEILGACSQNLRRVEFVISRRSEAERRKSSLLVPEFALNC